MSTDELRWDRFVTMQASARWVLEPREPEWSISPYLTASRARSESALIVAGRATLARGHMEYVVQVGCQSHAIPAPGEIDLASAQRAADEVADLLWDRVRTTALALAGIAGEALDEPERPECVMHEALLLNDGNA